VPVAAAASERKQQQQQQQQQQSRFLLSVDSTTDESRVSDTCPPRVHAPEHPEVVRAAAAEDAGNAVTSQSLSVPGVAVRRRSVSLGRTSSTFSRAFDEDDAAP